MENYHTLRPVFISFHFILLKTMQQPQTVMIHIELDSKATLHRQLFTISDVRTSAQLK